MLMVCLSLALLTVELEESSLLLPVKLKPREEDAVLKSTFQTKYVGKQYFKYNY